MARVFIGIPTLERPDYLRLTLGSVLAQTFTDYRVLVSDDGSKPAVVAQNEAFVHGLGRPELRFVARATPGYEYGQGRALFAAAEDTPYFMILHDDDLLAPEYLAEAVRTMDADPSLACFITNARVIDEHGTESAEMTRRYDATHGRVGRKSGALPILEPLLDSGFFPISGTLFRTASLRASGFVDPDLSGNFPFELNLLLNLGARREMGYLDAERRIAFRYHSKSLRNRLWFDRRIVGNVIRLLERHRFEGRAERRRRKILSFNHRRLAGILLGEGDRRACFGELRRALAANPLSWKNLLMILGTALAPTLVGRAYRERGRPSAPRPLAA